MTRQTKGKPQAADKYAGHKLQVRRKLLGISQEETAKRIGLTFQQIQKYESGINRISAGRLYQFAKMFDVPLAYFFDGLDDDTPQPFEGLPPDIYESDEAIAVLKAFFAIESVDKRKAARRMIEVMGD